jgi:MFS family permease
VAQTHDDDRGFERERIDPASDEVGAGAGGHLTLEDTEDALLEGDRPFAAGTARAALSYPVFRRVFFGAFLSNIGSWMQNVVLGAYGYSLTHSATFVSLLAFAQLVPLMLLSMVGGLLADRFDRKWLIIFVSIEQTAFAIGIAWITRSPHPSELLLVLFVLAMGIGQAVYAPAYSSVMPELVEDRDLVGAVSLNSANMNLSRVVGPAIGSLIYARFGVSWVFVGNAVSYLFIIGALLTVVVPRVIVDPNEPQGLGRVLGGFAVARRDRVVGRCLLVMTLFSLFSLAFVVQMPTIASTNLGIDPAHATYGLFYATFGTGAVVGALSIGTFLASRALERLVRVGLVGFSVTLAVLALSRNVAIAFPTVFVLGFFYFGTVTSLATVLQQRLDNQVRGRVMALWIMAFGGTVAIGGLAAGPLIELTSVTAVLLVGAAVALLLVPVADLHDHETLTADQEPAEPGGS